MTPNVIQDMQRAMAERFGEDFEIPLASDGLASLAQHRVHRDFLDRPVDPELLKMLCACAMSAPSKSDLQQRDIIIIQDPDLRARIAALMPQYAWVRTAPAMVIFCLNGRRLPQIAEWRGKPFPNDHCDLLFNAVADAAIALAWFQASVNMAGLGGCPVSEIRNHAELISEWLRLPDKVALYAGFCLGWPSTSGHITPRLPLSVTVHHDRFTDDHARGDIEAYDERREALHPARRQRDPDVWGTANVYGWSEDKAGQYAEPLRTDFGAYLRRRKFNLT
ncbi:MAG: nitroreductase [Hyphomicrobiales bacterium]|nr:nitroreductase [Hyphomicrobiales bacterium]